MTPRRRKSHRSRQQRIGFESLESRQVLTAAFVDVDPDIWAWDAGAAAESADIWTESWVASDGWYDDSWWVDDSSWNDEGSWSNDDWWVTADWSGDDSAVGIDVATAVVDGVVDDASGLQTGITVDAGSALTGGDGGSEWNAFAPETTRSPEPVPAAETFVVLLEPQDVAAESFALAEPSSEPAIDVLWGTISEGLTDVAVAVETAETSASDQDASGTDPTSYEVIQEGNDPAPESLDDADVAEWGETVLMVDDPVAMVDDPVAMVDDPVAMVDDPVAMFDDPVAVFDDPVAVFDEPVAVFDEPVAVFDEPVAVVDDPVAVVDDPVAVVDDPVAVVDDPVAVVDDPVAVFDDPVVMVDEPVAVFDEPVAMVDPTTLPPRPTVAKTQGLAGRFTSWFGMFMQGFGGFSASSDAASLSDSEIPGRGRLRGRLPFRPAN
jgi:hypothetical protein